MSETELRLIRAQQKEDFQRAEQAEARLRDVTAERDEERERHRITGEFAAAMQKDYATMEAERDDLLNALKELLRVGVVVSRHSGAVGRAQSVVNRVETAALSREGRAAPQGEREDG